MSTQDEWVKENLELLRNLQLDAMGMTAEDVLGWQAKLDEMSKRYDDARAREKSDKVSEAEKKRAKEVGDAIAKAVPTITKSVISAVKAFKSGDAINGCAEIMDICASLAPLISTFLSAAGPEGALVGALFSIVGQILRCFGPKQESDVSKLEKFMVELMAQDKLGDIKAVHDEVLAQARTLIVESQVLHAVLAKPLRTHEDYRTFTRGLDQTDIILSGTGPHKSVAAFEGWKVLEYLKNPQNQDNPLWPTVLGVYCKTYSDLVTSTMAITAMANTDDMQARLAEVDPDSPQTVTPPGTTPLTPGDKTTLESQLLHIQAYAGARKLEYESCNLRVLESLTQLTRVAQRWGLYGIITRQNHALLVTSGPKRVKAGDWANVGDSNYFHKFALAPDAATTIHTGQPESQFDFKPAYHCLVLKSTSNAYPGSNHWVDHQWIHSDTLTRGNYHDVLNNFKVAFTDIWVADQTENGLDVVAGTAEGTGAAGSVMAWTLDAKDDYDTASLERVDWWPQTTSPVGTIRAVADPTASLDDPDQTGIPLEGAGRVLYASMRGSTDIYVNTDNHDYYIAGPAGWGPATGITVDDTYLWLYQPYGFAVISHASVLNHLQSEKNPLRWLTYGSLGPALLGDDLTLGDKPPWHFNYTRTPGNWGDGPPDRDTKPPLLGLVSLSPCEDGTLLAAVVHRTIEKTTVPFLLDLNDTFTIQTATYDVDIKAGTIKVGAWTQITGDALQVQKLPMPGWALLSSLIAKLTPAKASGVSGLGELVDGRPEHGREPGGEVDDLATYGGEAGRQDQTLGHQVV